MVEKKGSARRMQVGLGLMLGCALVAVFGLGASAEGKARAEGGGFCAGTWVHDYEAPFARMKRLHAPPASGKLPFGPRALTFRSPEERVLVPGVSTHIAYGFEALSGEVLPRRIDWKVSAELTRVNAKGKPLSAARRQTIELATGSAKVVDGVGFEYGVASAPSFYLAAITFTKPDGKVLARYGQYFRVVAAKSRTTLAADHQSIARGKTLSFRVENSGTSPVSFGEEFEVEQEVNGQWIPAGLPRGPWQRHILGLGPGEAGPCQRVSISPKIFELGTYRVQKQLRGTSQPITAKFSVVG